MTILAKTLAAAAFAGLAALPAQAETIFVGNGVVVASTSACINVAPVGAYARMIWRPAYPGFDNGADSSLAYISSRASYTMITPNNTFRSQINYTGQSVGSTLTVRSQAGGILAWTQNPSTPNINTRTVNIETSLANFWSVVGCTATLRINFVRTK